GGEGHPGQLWRATLRFGQEQGDLLPVRFMIIDPTERRSPVVHRIEEPVLQNQISSIADSAHVVRGGQGSRIPVADMGRSSEASRNFASHDQGESHERIDEATEQANHCEGASTLEPGTIWATSPAAIPPPSQRFADEVQLKIDTAVVTGIADQARQVDLGC